MRETSVPLDKHLLFYFPHGFHGIPDPRDPTPQNLPNNAPLLRLNDLHAVHQALSIKELPKKFNYCSFNVLAIIYFIRIFF